MPALLAGFEEHARMLEHARQLRVVFIESYGSEADDTDFDEENEIEDNELLMDHLGEIIGEMKRLKDKLPEFTDDQEEEFRILGGALVDITSFRGTGWISLFEEAINVFLDILETGRINS